MKYILLKDYLTNDGVEIPKGTVFKRNAIRGQVVYSASIRFYKSDTAGDVETKLHLGVEKVESNPKWFARLGYWYISDSGNVRFQDTTTLQHSDLDKRRIAFGNYFTSEMEALVSLEGIRYYLTHDVGPMEAKRRFTSGKVTEDIKKPSPRTVGTYDRLLAIDHPPTTQELILIFNAIDG